jgi:hypothetical protein
LIFRDRGIGSLAFSETASLWPVLALAGAGPAFLPGEFSFFEQKSIECTTFSQHDES